MSFRFVMSALGACALVVSLADGPAHAQPPSAADGAALDAEEPETLGAAETGDRRDLQQRDLHGAPDDRPQSAIEDAAEGFEGAAHGHVSEDDRSGHVDDDLENENDENGSADEDGARNEPRLEWLPGLETFFAYRMQVFPEDGARGRSWFHVFDLERTLLWLGVHYGELQTRVMIEAVPGADEAGLLAVAGDSIVLRVREAWASYQLFERVHLRAGIVPELTQPMVEETEALRPIGKGPHERFSLLAPTDAGANVRVELPASFGEVGAGMYSGESYRSRELNRGKSTELYLRLHPLAFVEAARPLVLAGSYLLGSEGAGSARANRATVLLAWDAPWLKVGGSFTYAQGFAGAGGREGWLAHGFARVELLNHLLLGARVTHFRRDLDDAEDTVTTYQGAVGARVVEPLETYLVLTRNTAGERAAAAIPGSDSWELTALIRLRLEER